MPTVNDPSGTPQHVSKENMAKTLAVSESLEGHTNRYHKQAYTWQFSNDPDVGDDCIFYIKNNDEVPLILEGLTLFITAACEVYIKIRGSGTTAVGTPVTGVCVNGGGNDDSDVTCLHDGDVESGGTFSGGVEFDRFKYSAATDSYEVNFPMDVTLPKNAVFSLWVDTAGVVVTGTLYGFFHE